MSLKNFDVTKTVVSIILKTSEMISRGNFKDLQADLLLLCNKNFGLPVNCIAVRHDRVAVLHGFAAQTFDQD